MNFFSYNLERREYITLIFLTSSIVPVQSIIPFCGNVLNIYTRTINTTRVLVWNLIVHTWFGSKWSITPWNCKFRQLPRLKLTKLQLPSEIAQH